MSYVNIFAHFPPFPSISPHVPLFPPIPPISPHFPHFPLVLHGRAVSRLVRWRLAQRPKTFIDDQAKHIKKTLFEDCARNTNSGAKPKSSHTKSGVISQACIVRPLAVDSHFVARHPPISI